MIRDYKFLLFFKNIIALALIVFTFSIAVANNSQEVAGKVADILSNRISNQILRNLERSINDLANEALGNFGRWRSA